MKNKIISSFFVLTSCFYSCASFKKINEAALFSARIALAEQRTAFKLTVKDTTKQSRQVSTREQYVNLIKPYLTIMENDFWGPRLDKIALSQQKSSIAQDKLSSAQETQAQAIKTLTENQAKLAEAVNKQAEDASVRSQNSKQLLNTLKVLGNLLSKSLTSLEGAKDQIRELNKTNRILQQQVSTGNTQTTKLIGLLASWFSFVLMVVAGGVLWIHNRQKRIEKNYRLQNQLNPIC